MRRLVIIRIITSLLDLKKKPQINDVFHIDVFRPWGNINGRNLQTLSWLKMTKFTSN